MKEEILERLRKVFDYKGIRKASDLQHLMGFNHTTASNYFLGRQLPDLEKFNTITRTWEDINVRWIVTGEGKMLIDRSSGNVKLNAFSDREIMTYIASNSDRFKEENLTKRVFDAMFIDEWAAELDRQYKKIKEMFEKKYGAIE